MRWSVTVSKGSRVDNERNDSGISEVLVLNSCKRDTTLVLSSTSEAIEAMSPVMAIASAMSAIMAACLYAVDKDWIDICFEEHNAHKWSKEGISRRRLRKMR